MTLRRGLYQFHAGAFSLHRGMNVSVERNFNGAVTEKLRESFYVKAQRYAVCGEQVAQTVKMH